MIEETFMLIRQIFYTKGFLAFPGACIVASLEACVVASRRDVMHHLLYDASPEACDVAFRGDVMMLPLKCQLLTSVVVTNGILPVHCSTIASRELVCSVTLLLDIIKLLILGFLKFSYFL